LCQLLIKHLNDMICYKYTTTLIVLALGLYGCRIKEATAKHVQIELKTKDCGSRSHLKVENNISDIGTASVSFDNKRQFEIKYNYVIKTNNEINTLHVNLDYINNGVAIKTWKHSIVLNANFVNNYQPFENVTLNVVLID
jgi:hypothetical protein